MMLAIRRGEGAAMTGNSISSIDDTGADDLREQLTVVAADDINAALGERQ